MTRFALAIFRLLVSALLASRSRAHREAISAELADLLVDARTRGGWAAMRVWLAAVADLFRRTPYEHWLDHERERRKERQMRSLPQDIRYAIRGFGRQPGTTGLLLLTLTLGMSAVLAVFSLVNGLLLRPLPFPDSDQLVYLNETAPRWNLDYTGINYPDYHQWREGIRQFDEIGLYSGFQGNLAYETGVERVNGAAVTWQFGHVLGITPVIGRTFTADDDRPGGPDVIMIGSRLWQDRFGGAPDVVGRSLRMNSRPYQIIGVLPDAARFPEGYQFWTPLQGDPNQTFSSYSFEGIGRLKHGVSLEAARHDLLTAHQPIWAARDTSRTVSPRIEPLRGRLVDRYEVMTAALAVGVVLVLLAACTNVASTMLARAIFRQRELAVRLALGADAGRVGRLLLVESLLLASVGGVLGTIVGQAALRFFAASLPDGLPPWVDLSLDARTVLVALIATVGTSLVFGLAPVLQARRQDVRAVLGSSRGSLSVRQRRSLNGFVVAEVALATVLLVTSGLLMRTYQQVARTDLGFPTDNLLTFRIAPPSVRYPDSVAVRQLYDRLLGEIGGLPGVVSAAAVTCPPLSCHNGYFFSAEGAPPRPADAPTPVTRVDAVSAGYFGTVRLPLESGRAFTASDGEFGTPHVAIISETFARTHWPDGSDPVGRRIRWGSDGQGDPLTVVGVARDVRQYGLDRPPIPAVYLPLATGTTLGRTSYAVVVRSTGPVAPVLDPIRATLRTIDPELPMYAVGSMEDSVRGSLALRRAVSTVLVMFAIIALVLAVGGIYAVVSYVAGRRTIELGIRMALGAEQRQVMGIVIRQGVVLAAGGLILGIPIALAAARLLASRIEGLSMLDPAILLGVSALLLLVGAAAALIPARRAASLQPRVSLFSE